MGGSREAIAAAYSLGLSYLNQWMELKWVGLGEQA
jgi:hypothetical protein